MTRLTTGLAAFLLGVAAQAGDEPGGFSGEWKTTFGPVSLEQNGDDVTGRSSPSSSRSRGRSTGKALKFGYDEGQVHVDATLTLEPSGNAFKGTFRASNGTGASGTAGGPTRPRPRASPADFSGLWLTDLGLMELTQEGDKVQRPVRAPGHVEPRGGRHGPAPRVPRQGVPQRARLVRPRREGRHASPARRAPTACPRWYGWKGREAPEFVRHAPLVAGKIVDGSTDEPADLLRPRPRRLQAGRRQEVAGRRHPPRLEHERRRRT